MLATTSVIGQELHTFTTADGEQAHAYLYVPGSDAPARGLVLAFHQGGADARGEYGPIVPRLLAEGFHVLAVDLRSGGSLFGGVNQTVSARGESAPYCEAAADIESAIDLAQQLGRGRVVLWGSSYSAALVLRAAARGLGEGIAGVLAFSPATGPPMAGCLPEVVSASIRMPAFVFGSEAEVDRGPLRASFDAYRLQGIDVFVARPGAHGSSMLVPARVRGDVAPTWETVMRFLERVSPPVRR